MTDRQPLMYEQPSAPPPGPPYPDQPPPYSQPPPQPTYSKPAYAPLPQPGYAPLPQPGYPPPPQHGYGTATTVRVVQGQPIASHILLEVKPPNYIVMSVITMLCFCFIFGLIGLLMGIQVDSAWVAGDRDGARRYAASARGWNIAGIIVGVVIYTVIVISSVVSNASAA